MSDDAFRPKPGDVYLTDTGDRERVVAKVHKNGNVVFGDSNQQYRPEGGSPDRWDRLIKTGETGRSYLHSRTVLLRKTEARVAGFAAKAEHARAKAACSKVFDTFSVNLWRGLDLLSTGEIYAFAEAARPFAEMVEGRRK